MSGGGWITILIFCCENKKTHFFLLSVCEIEPTQYFIKSFTYAHMTLCRSSSSTNSCFKCECRNHRKKTLFSNCNFFYYKTNQVSNYGDDKDKTVHSHCVCVFVVQMDFDVSEGNK